MQRAASALRNRAGQPSGGSGGGGGQRELARQAEAEARRLERLAREQDNPQLAETARQLREVADAMRRAGGDESGSASQGGNALDRLRRATRNLETAKARGLAEQFRDLERRAGELAARQQEIAEGLRGLGSASPAERRERLRRLDERKDGLAAEVDRLQSDAERAAREGRREQPGAASRAGQAAEAIQQGRLRDRIVYSKGVMRGNSPDYARRFEEQITEGLGGVADRLREAAGALGQGADDRRDRALARARDLVRGLESLQERTGNRESATGGRQGSDPQGGQQPGGEAQSGPVGGQSGRQPGGTGPAHQGGLGPNPAGGGATPGRLSAEAARQFGREFRMRREAAESLRREVAGQGIETGELDRAIRGLRQLETGAPFSDPKAMADLQQSIIEGLKTWEFRLWRALTQGSEPGPAVGSAAQAPAEYRALVEEYYRALAREKKPGRP